MLGSAPGKTQVPGTDITRREGLPRVLMLLDRYVCGRVL